MLRFLMRWIRSNSRQIPVERAQVWKGRLAFVYMVAAWNLLAYVGYTFYNKNVAPDTQKYPGETLAEAMIRRGQVSNAHVYRYNNFTKVTEKDKSVQDESDPQSKEELVD